MIFLVRVTLTIIWIFGCSIILMPLAPFLFPFLELNYVYGRFFYPLGSLITGIKVKFLNPGVEDENRPCIFVANHQSALDILVFGKHYPRRTVLIGKKEIWYVPFFNIFYWAGRNIFIDRKNRTHSIAGLEQAVAHIHKHRASIWIFPEGTRNRSDQPLLNFKKGAFHMAIKAQVPIVPIVASSMRGFMNWDAKLLRPGKVLVKTLPAISTHGMTNADIEPLMLRVREIMEKEILHLTAMVNETQ